MPRTPSRSTLQTPTQRTPTRPPRTPGRGTLTPTPARRRKLSIVSESSPPSSPTEITFITLPPPLPDRRSPRPNPLHDRQRKAASAPVPTPRKRHRTTSLSTPSPFVPTTQPPVSNFRQSVEAPEQPALPGPELAQGIQIPAPIASNADFCQFLSDLDAEGITDDMIRTPVEEAVVDAMWEACTFLRDTVPALKGMATGLLREILNRAA